MTHSFHLRKPKGNNETLILFSCYFKDEQKQFVYSTRKSIYPSHWDFINTKPKNRGKQIASDQKTITNRLSEFTSEFDYLENQCGAIAVKFTSQLLKKHFDQKFENVTIKKTSFFEVYELFMEERIKRQLWSNSTIKRYFNIKNLLLSFEKEKKYALTLNSINSKFLTEFTDYCYSYKGHCTNTYSRNLGLVITFLNWSLENKHTFNTEFKKFKKPSRVLTRQEALTKENIEQIYNHKFKTIKEEITKDLFVIQCLTGVRYEDVHSIGRANTFEDYILVKDGKDPTKPERTIPLLPVTKEILMKYDYVLPERSNQKQNDYIKEILKKLDFTREVEYTVAKGSRHIKYTKPFYKRITTHTARRSYITIMRNHGIADKTIMSISGHKDIRTFNMYHQVNNDAKIHAVKSVFENF